MFPPFSPFNFLSFSAQWLDYYEIFMSKNGEEQLLNFPPFYYAQDDKQTSFSISEKFHGCSYKRAMLLCIKSWDQREKEKAHLLWRQGEIPQTIFPPTKV